MRLPSLPTTRRTLLQRGLQASGALGLGLFTGQGGDNQTLAATPGKHTKEVVDLIEADENHQRTGEADIIELANGELLLAYTDFRGFQDDAAAVLRSCRSYDGGRSWTAPQLLVDQEGRQNVAAVSFVRVSSSVILLCYDTKHSHEIGLLTVRRSSNNGKSFDPPVYCAPDNRFRNLCNDCVIRLKNGRILIPFTVRSKVISPAKQRILHAGCAYSDDDGQSWKLSNEIFVPKSGAMEPKIVELRDGRLWMLVRTDQGRLGQSFSTDGGTTWAKADFTNIAAPQAPFIFTRIPSTGDLLLIRNPQVDMTHHHQGPRTPLRCTISSDEGKTWRFTVDLEKDHSWAWSYGSCTFVDDFAILSYYKERFDKPWHTFRITRVPVAWLYG